MKIKEINISNYRHLKDLKLDFTYKTGPRKGEPLDKVCFIGQSGTGKTTILDIIDEFCTDIVKKETIMYPDEELINIEYLYKVGAEYRTSDYPAIIEKIKHRNSTFLYGYDQDNGVTIDEIREQDKLSTYITSEILNSSKNILERSETNHALPVDVLNEHDNKKNIKFSDKEITYLWDILLADINIYDQNLEDKGKELVKQGLHINPIKMDKIMNEWKKENINPRIELAEKLFNPILKKLNLELDVDAVGSYITLKNINSDETIPGNGLSTGTKQLIISSLPFYYTNSEDSIIMIDEPERSLFPDVQMQLIEHYLRITKGAQLFVATHSPFIAASFEPEERFILQFDKNGKVQVTNGVTPRGDDPNDILKKDFKLSSLMPTYGKEKYKEYLDLKQQAYNEVNEEKKNKLIKQAVELGDKYNF